MCNHCTSSRTFHRSKKESRPVSSPPHAPPHFLSLAVPDLDIAHKWNHTPCGFPCKALLLQEREKQPSGVRNACRSLRPGAAAAGAPLSGHGGAGRGHASRPQQRDSRAPECNAAGGPAGRGPAVTVLAHSCSPDGRRCRTSVSAATRQHALSRLSDQNKGRRKSTGAPPGLSVTQPGTSRLPPAILSRKCHFQSAGHC